MNWCSTGLFKRLYYKIAKVLPYYTVNWTERTFLQYGNAKMWETLAEPEFLNPKN